MNPATTGPEVPPPLERIVEALLFVGGPPLTEDRARAVLRGMSSDQFRAALAHLDQQYRRQGRPYRVQVQGPGYVLALRPRYRAVVDKLYGGVREARLSQAAVDVLALVAYRQPVTRQEVETLRGADCGAVLRQLVRRGLIAVQQRAESGRGQVAYGTTPRFLELFGLRSLDDLPQTQDLQKL